MRFVPGFALLTVFLALSLAPGAHAGEVYLGKIVVTDGGWATNRCTTIPFAIGAPRQITAQCDQAVAIGTGVSGCDAGVCLTVAAGEKFPTSIGNPLSLTCNSTTLADAGINPVTYYGGHLAIQPVSTAAVTCNVYARSGTE